MNDLTIEKMDGCFFVECNNRTFEHQHLSDVLENVSFISQDQRNEAEYYLSVLFSELGADYVALGGEGRWWYASARVPVVKDYDNKYYDVEDEYDPLSALSALEAAARGGMDDENGLAQIDRILRWMWFV
jgi:hypothetical protein